MASTLSPAGRLSPAGSLVPSCTLPPAGRLTGTLLQRSAAPHRVPRGSPSLALPPSEFKGSATITTNTTPSHPPGAYRGRNGGALGARAFLEVSAPATAKWVLRLFSYYALLRIGVAKEAQGGAIDNVQKFVTKKLFGDHDAKREKEARKAAVKWKESTKGTLVRKLRVPSVSQGRKLLGSIAGLLAEDDLFVDVGTHKGCQIRRETAHSESVCCHNVRALFDELPTPHLEVEITVFPAGPLTAREYQKAQKLEVLLKKGITI